MSDQSPKGGAPPQCNRWWSSIRAWATESCHERRATLPHERSGVPVGSRTARSPYRGLAFTMVAYWLSLERQQKAVDELVANGSCARGGAGCAAAINVDASNKAANILVFMTPQGRLGPP
jgi:hypothetical protein